MTVTAAPMERAIGFQDPQIVEAHGYKFTREMLIPSSQIQARVGELASDIAAKYADRGALRTITVLDGAAHFASDLRRRIARASILEQGRELNMSDGQVCLKSFSGDNSSGQLRKTGNNLTAEDIEGQHILVIEGIIYRGTTFKFLRRMIENLNPKSLEVALAVDRPCPTRKKEEVLGGLAVHRGFKLADSSLVVGYGLDWHGLYRNMDDIYSLQPVLPSQR